MTWRLITIALALLVVAVVSFLLSGCQPWVNPLDYPQKIDAPRHVDHCECGEKR